MSLFKSTTPLETAITARVKLRDRLTEAKTATLTAKATTRRLALAGASDSELSASESHERHCIHRETTLTAAIVESDAQVAALEAERDEAADRRQRHLTVKDNQKLEAELIKEGEVTVASAKRMSEIAARIIPMAPEANGVKHFADVTVTQIPDAVTLLSRLIREHSAAVLRRDAPSTVKKPALPYVVPAPVPVAPTKLLFATRAVKWRDENNKQQLGAKCRDVYIPTRLVAKALASGACIAIDDPRRRELSRWPSEHPRLDTAFDLEVETLDTTHIEPITFTPLDRGPARQIQIAR